MTAKRADALSLTVGQIPEVRVGLSRHPVQKVALEEKHLLAYLFEIANPLHAQAIADRKPCRFPYRDFVVEVTFSGAGVAAEIQPVPTQAPAPGLELPMADDPLALESDSGLPIQLADIPAPPPRPPAPVSVPAVEAAPVGSPATYSRPAMPRVSDQPAPMGLRDDTGSSSGSFLRRAWVLLVVLGVTISALAAAVIWYTRPATIPEVTFTDSEGESVSLAQLRGDKERLLLVFLLPGCSISRYSLKQLKEIHPKHEGDLAFAGLLFAKQTAVEKFVEKNEVPFPVYGLRDTDDPLSMNALIGIAGDKRGTREVVYGGTVLVVDGDRTGLVKLEKEELQDLPGELADLAE